MYWGEQIRKNEVGRICGTNERKRSSCGNLVRKHEGKRPLGKPTCRRDEIIIKNNISKKYDEGTRNGLICRH
jgi:hypothetical protein